MRRTAESFIENSVWRLTWVAAGCVLLLGLLITYMVVMVNVRYRQDDARAKAVQDLATVRAQLEGVTATVLSSTDGISDLISFQGSISADQFNSLSAQIIARHPQIRNIAIAPDDTIAQVYPLAGNERVIGMRYATIPEQYRTVQRARESGQPLLSGPHQLVQGGEGVILRSPVFTRHGATADASRRYWGVVSIVINLDTIIEASGIQSASGIDVGIRRDGAGSDHERHIWGDQKLFASQPVTMAVKVPGGFWELAAITKGGWPREKVTGSAIFYVGLTNTLLLTIVAWMLSRRHQLLRQRNRELQQEIMDRTRAEVELRLSEQKYASIFHLMPDMVGITRMDDGSLVEVNAGFERISGWAACEIIGRKSTELGLWQPEVRAEAIELVKKVGRLENFPFMLGTKSGEQRQALMYLTPIRIRDEECLYFMVRDVSELTLSQQSLEKERTLLRNLLQTVPALVWMKDPEGVYLFCNTRFERFFGAREAEILGRTDYDFVDRDLADFFRQHDRKAMAAGGPSTNEEWVTYADDGHRELLETIKTPVCDVRGELVGVLGIARDITAHRQAEDALREEQSRFQGLVDSVDGIVWEADAETLIFTFVSRQAERLLGYPVEAWLQSGFWVEHIHPEDREQTAAYCLAATARCEDHEFEYRMIASDGRSVWLHDIVTVVAENGAPRWLRGVMVDMTATREAAAEKEKLEAQLLQAQKMEAIGRLASGVAHDFNNKLTAIFGYAELARGKGAASERYYEYLGQIIKAATQSRDITRQLLAFSRQELISPRIIRLNDLIAEVRKGVGRFIGEDIHFELVLAPDLWQVCMDPSQVDQVIMNLVVNARDAMADGGRLTIASANVVVSETLAQQSPDATPGDYVLITVSDTGCGMDRETLQHIFEPFYTTKEAGKGTGLGLATLYGIVTQNRGFVLVESEPGRGTSFRIYLPRAAGKEEEGATGVDAIPPALPATILLVEDDETVRMLTGEVLEQAGYRTVVAASAQEALTALATSAKLQPLDLLITDVIMPGMNGRDLAIKVAELCPGVLTLFMSGYTADIISQKGVLENGINFIQKPFEQRNLLLKVHELLQHRKPGPQP